MTISNANPAFVGVCTDDFATPRVTVAYYY